MSQSETFLFEKSIADRATILVEAWRDNQRTDVIDALAIQGGPMKAAALVGMMFEEMDAQERHDLSRNLLRLAAKEQEVRNR